MTHTRPLTPSLIAPLLLLLTGCATPPPAGEAPLRKASYETSTRSGNNRLVIHGHSELTKVEIYSDHGIGTAAVTLTGGDWPRAMVVRMHTRLLERFEIATLDPDGIERTMAGVSVNSYGDHDIRQDPAREHGDPLYLPLKIVDYRTAPAAPRLPIRAPEGYFEITVPPAMLRSDAAAIKLSWIDVYRN